MRIKNENLAGVILGLRHSPGETVTVGDDGVVDVPKKDAEFLLSTPGWTKPKKGRSVAEAAPEPAPAPPPEPEPEPEPEPSEPEPEPEAPEAPEAPEDDGAGDEGDDAEEGPDLDSMTKAQLIATAKEYEVDVDPYLNKADIKAELEEALYGEGE